MKKILLTLSPIAIVVLIIFAVTTFGRAKESTTGSFEKYYNEDESNNGLNESTIVNSDSDLPNPSEAPTEVLDDDRFNDDLVEETPATVDTDPTSITVLVNKSYHLQKDYEPDDLVVPNIKFSFTQYDPKMQLRSEAATAMENLFNAALEEGLQLAGVSGYRSYKRQFEIYATNLIRRGIAFTNQYSAMAGASEHQTGLAMDISTSSINYRLSDEFANTAEGRWVSEHCYKYGFIVRFQADKTNVTGYSYEPWHIRYVGIPLATYLTEHDLTLDEYYGYSYDEQTPETIDYDAIIQEYYVMKGIDPNRTTQAPTQSPDDIEDFESLEEDLIGDDLETSEDVEDEEDSTETSEPTAKPTAKPTQPPEDDSTSKPDKTPTESPTEAPSEKPTQTPSVTPEESLPSTTPTPEVTPNPTQPPVSTPTPEVTETPVESPTPSPTVAPEGNPIISGNETITENSFQEY